MKLSQNRMHEERGDLEFGIDVNGDHRVFFGVGDGDGGFAIGLNSDCLACATALVQIARDDIAILTSR